ncbi:MAG: DMT family transporter [Bacteroidota bacterium]
MKNIAVKLPAYLCLAGAMGIAGSSVVVAKIIACRLPVFLSCACSLAVAVAFLLPLSLKRGKGFPKLPSRALVFLGLQALTGLFLFRVALFYGLRIASALEAGVMVSTLPAITALLALFILGESLTWRKATGIALAVAGLCCLNLPGAAANGGRHPGAVFLILGAVTGEALFTVLQKKVPQNVPPVTATALISLIGLLLFLPGAVYEAVRFDFGSLAPSDLLYTAYYGLIVTALAYILFIAGAKKVPAGTAGMFCGLMPVAGALLSWAVLGESFGLGSALGLSLVLPGILLVESL